MMDKAFPANAAVYPLVRQARMRGDADWQIRFSSPLGGAAALGALASSRQLANVLGDTALYYHFKGNDHEAIETLLDCQYLAQATAARKFAISALVATGIDAVAMRGVQLICTDLRIPPGESGNQMRAKVRELIDRLLDDGPVRRWHADALASESVIEFDADRTRNDLFVLRAAGSS